ncbi:response regulator [Patescibacteria group bacterium]|nr:response regulator [Patescibacteria group bacterium]
MQRVETKEAFTRGLEDPMPDLILSDYSLPSFDGLSALVIAQEKCPDVPFILISGVISEDVAIDILKKGAVDYVLKDRLSRLVPVVYRALKEFKERTERKKAEEKLRREHNLLQTLIDTTPDSIYFKDVEGRFVMVNKTKAEHSGIKPEDMIGKTDFDFLPREQAEKSFRDDKHAMEIGSSLTDIIEKITHPNKTEHWISATKIPWYDKGNPMGTIGISRDITERKKAEEALKKKSHDLTERMKELNCLYRISRLADKQDIPLEEILQETVNLIPPSWQYPEITCARIIVEGQEFASENYRETEWKLLSEIIIDGYQVGTVEIYYLEERPKNNEGPFLRGEIDLINAIARRLGRIIQRKKIEEELRIKNSAVASSINAIVFGDLKGNLIYVNHSFLEMWGYDEENEVLGKPSVGFWQMGERAAEVVEALRSSGSWTGELRAKRKDGLLFDVQLSGSMVMNEDGKPICMMGSFIDITEDKRVQDELQQAKEDAEVSNRAKSDFLANMSHEIRTPMNTIVGMADLLSETQLIPEQQQYINTLQTAGETLLSLISDILDLSKIEGSHLDLEEIDFDLEEILRKTGQIMAMRAHKKGLELSYQVMPDVPNSLIGDPARLRQILINLITNAIKFTEKGEVLIEIQCDKNRSKVRDDVLLRFSIKDTGIGIPQEKLNSIFDSFTQVSSSTTRQYGGTGLGLTISQRLIELMGGRIWVESKVGEGSTFYFTAQFGIQTQPKKPITLPLVDLNRLKVLVIDDNATNRMILNKVLTRWGMRVTEAENGKQGITELEHAKKNDNYFQLVLLDSRMPGMSGLEVAKYIKKETSLTDVTIIMLTSDARSEERVQCRELGIGRYLVKPVSSSELFDAITAAIGHKRIAGEAAGTVMRTIPVKGKDSLRILLVEDSKDNRLLIQAHLKRTPYQIDIAENGKIAIEKFTSKKYDLVLMDIQMPVMDGHSATKAIRKWEREKGVKATPVIALTAHAFKEDMQKSLNAGCTDHITKPIRKQLLLKVIQTYAQAILKKEVSDETPHKKIAVRVSEEIKDLIPGFLAHRTEDVKTLGEKLERGDFQAIQILGHSMKGSGAGYGFDVITDIGGSLEQAAKNKDTQRIQQQIDRLSTYLESLEVTYE